MITFHIESWAQYEADCQELWKLHYDEIAVSKERMPMRPDVTRYKGLEASGQLMILTARKSGAMIGYYLATVMPHPHYADVLCGFEDSYFVAPAERKGMVGVRLIKEAEKRLKQRGVKKVFVMTKSFKDLGRIFERLGYEQSDICYAKWIGE
jgi:GNAT superfamily N-acetyltransferase